jgi:hypothetical protein
MSRSTDPPYPPPLPPRRKERTEKDRRSELASAGRGFTDSVSVAEQDGPVTMFPGPTRSPKEAARNIYIPDSGTMPSTHTQTDRETDRQV